MEYLRLRFAGLANTAGTTVEAVLQEAVSPGSGARLVFDSQRLGDNARARFLTSTREIILASGDRDIESRVSSEYRNVSTMSLKGLNRGIRVSLALLLAHETIHDISSTLVRSALGSIPCDLRMRWSLTRVTDPNRRQSICASLHDDNIGTYVVLDIGTKWEAFVMGEGRALGALYGSPDLPAQYYGDRARSFLALYEQFAMLMERGVPDDEMTRRRERLYQELERESNTHPDFGEGWIRPPRP